MPAVFTLPHSDVLRCDVGSSRGNRSDCHASLPQEFRSLSVGMFILDIYKMLLPTNTSLSCTKVLSLNQASSLPTEFRSRPLEEQGVSWDSGASFINRACIQYSPKCACGSFHDQVGIYKNVMCCENVLSSPFRPCVRTSTSG